MINLIIDGNNIAHRCFWISQKQTEKLITSYGQNVGCVYVFLNSIKSFMKNFNTNNVYVCWDKKLTYPTTNFRKELSQGQYKAQRPQEDRDELYSQIDIVEKILPSLGIKNVYPNVMEGDDVIAYLSKTLEGNNIIISVDQDLCQLISEKTSFYNLNKKVVIDINNFEEHLGVKKEHFLLHKAIIGDTSDNIKGVKGYGKVKAKKLCESWSTIVDPEIRSVVENNLKLIDLSYGYNVYPDEVKSYEEQISKFDQIKPNMDQFKEYCNKYEFKSYMAQINEWESLFNNRSIDLSKLFSK